MLDAVRILTSILAIAVSSLTVAQQAPVPSTTASEALGAQESANTPHPDSPKLMPTRIARPVYPAGAEQDKVQGEVVVALEIDESGAVSSAQPVSGDARLSDAAVSAAKRFAFEPFYKNGHPVKVKTKLPFEFAIAGDKNSPVAQNHGTFAVASSDAAAAEITKSMAGVVPGKIVHRVVPRYPEIAAAARIQGRDELTAVIGKDGRVYDVHVVSGHPLLVPAVVSAVKEWRFEPYTLAGEPVAVETRISATFTQPEPHENHVDLVQQTP